MAHTRMCSSLIYIVSLIYILGWLGTGEVTGWPEVQFSVQWAALSSIQIRPCLAIYPPSHKLIDIDIF
jgi:hypothetical protein